MAPPCCGSSSSGTRSSSIATASTSSSTTTNTESNSYRDSDDEYWDTYSDSYSLYSSNRTTSSGSGSGSRGRGMRREGRGRFLSEISAQDYQTLTEIKAFTSFLGDVTWKPGVPCENLFGVQCKAGRVVSLSLLKSTASLLAPPICKLDQLAGLTFLQGNTASLPTCLSKLSSVLEGLFIDKAALEGTLPAVLFTLTSLVDLSLTYNQLNGSVPPSISSLARLQTLNLGNNDLSSTIPQQLLGLQSLTLL